MKVDMITSDYYQATHFLMKIYERQMAYRNKNDRFGYRLAELGFNNKDLHKNKIKTIKFSKSGWFKAVLDESIGENITIKYTPVDRRLNVHKGPSATDRWNDAQLSPKMREEAHQDRQLRNRRTYWKCKTNFKYKVNGCDNSKPFKYR